MASTSPSARNYKAALVSAPKAAPAPAPAAVAAPVRTYRIPSYFVEDEHRYRVFTAEEADYLDRCEPHLRAHVIALLKSGKLRLG